MRRSSRLSNKRKERDEEEDELKAKQIQADGDSEGEEEEEEEEETTRKSKRTRKAVATSPRKKKAPAKPKAKPKKAKAAPKRASGRKKAVKEESDEEEEEETEMAVEEAEEAPEQTGIRRSRRLSSRTRAPVKVPSDEEEEEDDSGNDGDAGEEEDGDDDEEKRKEKARAKPVPTWGQQRQQLARGRHRAQLRRSNSYSANDLINASYRDLFGLGTVPRPPPPRRSVTSTPRADPSASSSSTSSSSSSSTTRDRWVLLQHHHWLLKTVHEDGRVDTDTNVFNGFAGLDEEGDENDGAENADGLALATGPQRYSDDEGALPLYFDPPADGSSCFDELPTETVMHIFSFFNAATMAQAMGVCSAWNELLSDDFFWKRQYLMAEPLVLKPYNNWNWNQFCAYAIRFLNQPPVVGREVSIADVNDISNMPHQKPANPNPTEYEFEEVYYTEPITGQSRYVLNRNDKHIDNKFGLGLVVMSNNSWGGFRSDSWWLEHYTIGSRREEELQTSRGKYKSLCNPKLWRWRLLHSDGKEEVTGVLLINIGYLEQLVEEGNWREELTKVDIQFMHHVMHDAANSLDFRVFEQQSIPEWLQWHKRAERKRHIEERKLLRQSQDKGKEVADPPASTSESMDVEPESESQEGALEADKPFRHTKPEDIASKLYSYQLESLTWMTEIEDRVSRGMYWEAASLISFPEQIGTHIYMDPDGTALSTYEQLDKKEHFVQIYTRGGILAEEMGLGKTLIILALITLQRQNFEKIALRDEKLYPLAENLFRTRATLVLCPSHLAKQWETEVAKHTNPALKVLVITTILQHRQITYKDVLDADLVVVSFSFLVNKNYEGVRPSCHPSSLGNDDPKLAQRRGPLLTQFRWLRMVLDEAHELPMGVGRKGKTGIEDVNAFQATFRWYVTGSPFPHGRQSLHNALDLLRLKVKVPTEVLKRTGRQQGDDNFLNIQALRYGVNFMPSIEQVVMKNLYCRHTKQSVSNEYTLPGMQTQVVLIRQTVVERALYEVAKIEKRDDDMRQLCCHPQLANSFVRMGMQERNIWELFGETIETKKQQIKSTTTAITALKTSIQSHTQHLKDLKADWKRQRAWLPKWNPTKGEQERKLGLKNSIRKEKKELSSLEASLEMFESSLAHLEEVDAKYHIVKRLRKMKKGKPVDTTIEEADQKEGLARLEAATNDLPSAMFMSPDTISDDLVSVHGSKMPHLLLFVQQLCEDEDSRIIIFSQWTRLLMLIGNLLENHDVRTLFCRGNVYQRNKAITAFQKSVSTQEPKKVAKGKEVEAPPRVLMLSLENAASGTNLTQATHIILVDPICGSRSRAHAIEAQAIGRAHRLGQTQKLTVVRFLVVDTIEHETYLRNYVKRDEEDDEDDAEGTDKAQPEDAKKTQAS